MKPSETRALLRGEGQDDRLPWRHPRGESYATSQPTDAAQLRYFDEGWGRMFDVKTMRELLGEAGAGRAADRCEDIDPVPATSAR